MRTLVTAQTRISPAMLRSVLKITQGNIMTTLNHSYAVMGLLRSRKGESFIMSSNELGPWAMWCGCAAACWVSSVAEVE